MTMTPKQRERFRTVWFMALITFVSISCVSGLHLATAATVKRNESLFLKRAVAAASGQAAFKTAAELQQWYDARVESLPAGQQPPVCYRVADEQAGTAAYVFVRRGPGLWGPITAVAGLDGALTAFTGVTFTENNETPGLGARIDEPWFGQQFKGKTGPFRLVPEKTRSASPEEMDAITGATITSAAVQGILNGIKEEAAAKVKAAR